MGNNMVQVLLLSCQVKVISEVSKHISHRQRAKGKATIVVDIKEAIKDNTKLDTTMGTSTNSQISKMVTRSLSEVEVAEVVAVVAFIKAKVEAVEGLTTITNIIDNIRNSTTATIITITKSTSNKMLQILLTNIITEATILICNIIRLRTIGTNTPTLLLIIQRKILLITTSKTIITRHRLHQRIWVKMNIIIMLTRINISRSQITKGSSKSAHNNTRATTPQSSMKRQLMRRPRVLASSSINRITSHHKHITTNRYHQVDQ